MRVGAVAASEIVDNACRLTGGFHLSEDHEAMRALARVASTSRLGDLTKGRGVFRGPIFVRKMVSDPSIGRPYVSAKDLVQATIHPAGYISLSHGDLLNELELHEHMVLVTCSGMNLGQAIWVRKTMHGLCASHDLIRIEVDEAYVPAGYLYAFLASDHGRVSIRRQIYGGSVKHVEPQHVAMLRVPRLGTDIESRVNRLILDAAKLRTSSERQLIHVVEQLPERLGLQPLSDRDVGAFGVSIVRACDLAGRLDAPYHSPAAIEVERALSKCTVPVKAVPDVVERYFKPPLFKRLWVDGPEYGPLFISGNDAYRVQPEELRYVSKRTPRCEEFILHRGWVVFQAAGQIYGLFGRPLLVEGWLENAFCADDMYRIVPHSETDGGYIFAFLSTPHGEVVLKRQASGNSIPRVWDPHVRRMRIPWPEQGVREDIGRKVIAAHLAREQARLLEAEGIGLVERTIEAGVNRWPK